MSPGSRFSDSSWRSSTRTIVNVALDTLSHDLQAPLGTIQWVSTGYLLSLATVLPLSGWVTERFGSKRTWIAAIAMFAIGSALCALATSAAELIAFRVLQGVGGGLLVPVGFTLVAQSAGPRQIGRALALMGVPILLAPIFGPIIGGLIVDSAPWQWIFVVNVPIAVVAILVAVRLLQADAGRAESRSVRLARCGTAVPRARGRRLRALGDREPRRNRPSDIRRAGHRRARSGRAVRLAQPARTAAADRGAPVPLTRLPRRRQRYVLLAAALFGTLLVLPLYYQVARGESALMAGLLIAPQGLGAAAMLPISGRLTDRIGGGPVTLAGCCLAALATLPLAFVTDDTPYALLGVVLFARGLGFGASIQPSAAAAYALLESSQVPRATAALNSLRQIGASIGTTFLAVVLQHEGAAALSAPGGAGGRLLDRLPEVERARLSDPLATAFAHTFRWSFVLVLLAIVPAVALLRAERAESPREPFFTRSRLRALGRRRVSSR